MGSLGLMGTVAGLDTQDLQVREVLLEMLEVLVCLLEMENLGIMGFKDRGGLRAMVE